MPRGRPFKCPYEGCGSTNTVSKGARTTKSMGVRKIRLCKSCYRKFTPKNQRPVQVEAKDPVEPEDSMPAEPRKSKLTEPEIPE